MTSSPLNIAVVGLGHWGPNLARNFNLLPDARLHTLCDADPARLQRVGANYPAARQTDDFDSVLADPAIDAVVLATPVHTHFKLASAALQAGKHTFVEKPLARTSAEARQLVELADARDLILMVGHVFLYNAAVRKVKEFIDTGELGEIYYIYAQRLNLGIVRQDVNALWNFAPHDISIINYWLDGAPVNVDAHGYAYLQPGIEDVVFMNLEYAGGQAAGVHVSWLDPNKVRRMTVVGSKKMVVYDDVSPDAKIKLFDKGVDRKPGNGLGSYATFGEFQLLLRAGDLLVPKINFTEPLRAECGAFVEAMRTGEPPLADGRNGLAVVEVLEAADRAMK
jgi:predicted dehydrogenase